MHPVSIYWTTSSFTDMAVPFPPMVPYFAAKKYHSYQIWKLILPSSRRPLLEEVTLTDTKESAIAGKPAAAVVNVYQVLFNDC